MLLHLYEIYTCFLEMCAVIMEKVMIRLYRCTDVQMYVSSHNVLYVYLAIILL